MFNKYYEEELAFLREMGREFALAHPAIAHMLETTGADPDVERLLEGVAFLTGRVRQKLDDELPELFQSLMSLLWPHYLRPIPSTGILAFEPLAEQLNGVVTIPRGTEVESVNVDGTACRMRTCYDVELAPLAVESAEIELPMASEARLRLVLRATGKVPLEKMAMSRLRFHLYQAEDMVRAATIYLWLMRYARAVILRDPDTERSVELRPNKIRPGGFAREEALLPYPAHSFDGYRLLQEYFTCPAKYYFVDIFCGEHFEPLGAGERLELIIPFTRRPDEGLRIDRSALRLFCTPIVNLFEHAADGIRVDHRRTRYRVRPTTAGSPPEHYEIYSVSHVVGLVQGEAERREYPPLHAFSSMTGGRGDESRIYYQTHLMEAVVGEGTDTHISFVTADQRNVVPPTETISLDILATNRNLASRLKVGDVHVPTSGSPEFARFRNITPISRSVRPPLGRGLHWRLISHLRLNYLSLLSVEALRAILELYNYQALYDLQAARQNTQRLEGIVALRAAPAERLLKGTPVRGTAIELDMDEDRFAGVGDMYIFATVLNEFFALYASLNAMTELNVFGTRYGEKYTWPARLGQQIIL